MLAIMQLNLLVRIINKLIGIAEYNGGIFNLEGINVDHAKKYFLKHGSFKDYPKATFIKDASYCLKNNAIY